MKFNAKIIVCLSVFTVIGWIFFVSNSNSAGIVMKIGHAVAAKSATGIAMDKFKGLVEKRTDGKVTVEIFHAGALGGELEMLDKLQTGVIQGTFISGASLSTFAPKVQILFLPFLFPDWESFDETLANPEVAGEIFQSLEEKNIVMLESINLGEYNISTSKKPFLSLKDLNGLKIRSKENVVSVDGLKAIGCSPTPIAFPEIYQALQTGTIDAISMPVQYTLTSKFYEVIKFITITYIEPTPSGLEVNKKWWEGIPKDIHSIIASTANEVVGGQRKEQKKYYGNCIEELMDKGVYIRFATREEKRKLREMTKPVRDKYMKELGAEKIIKKIEEKNKDRW